MSAWEIHNKILLEKCYWYIGNAYLQKNDMKNALLEFNKILELDLELKQDAEKQISRIEARKK